MQKHRQTCALPAVKTRRHRLPPFFPWPPTKSANFPICRSKCSSLSVHAQALASQACTAVSLTAASDRQHASGVITGDPVEWCLSLTSSFCFSMLIMALKSCPPGTDLSTVALFSRSTSGSEVLWPACQLGLKDKVSDSMVACAQWSRRVCTVSAMTM